MKQKTIRKTVEFEGTGLFSGEKAVLRFLPAQPNSGIAFIRTDLPEKPRLPVSPGNTTNRMRRTTLSVNNVEVETIEHILAATTGLGIDNLDIEISALETPCADGSALPFAQLLQSAGIVEQTEDKPYFAIQEPISVSEKDSSIIAIPSDSLTISYTLSYDGIAQYISVCVSEESFMKELAPARTYCFEEEARTFILQGVGKGANYQNTLVIGPNGPINNELRFPDELVRHKALDLIGDLSLLNFPLKAHIIAVKTGHDENLKLAKKILAKKEAVENNFAPPETRTLLDVREILKILPHRYPFLLIDKVIEMDSYKSAVGIKNVTFNEPFFQGHFPGQPIMPGVLQIEAMAQLAGALLLRKAENTNKLAVLIGLDAVKIRKTVVPGDQLRIEAQVTKIKSRTAIIYTKSTVDGSLVSEAIMKFMILDAEQ
ncbi:MAG: UDP-3-O-[3-hydroxymyristoyl] N-acetylglucosamine deacetylase [Planctomycetes bacterium]|nr:UDP-3-O-[3-hydroxymyristoyl] N-acetylglucosamine deacetylase [Planctomycetota bacterium]